MEVEAGTLGEPQKKCGEWWTVASRDALVPVLTDGLVGAPDMDVPRL